jgi:hypothetical protein
MDLLPVKLCAIKFFMRWPTRIIAIFDLLLISPAALFMTALVLRTLQSEPSHTAQRIVMWYSARMWTLWVLLLALPFTVLVTGGAVLLHGRSRDLAPPNATWLSLATLRAQPASLFVAATTLTAASILVIVVLHMLGN